MSLVEVKSLTKDYGNNQGIFNISFSLEEGEIIGLLGSNGAGKTTLIRHLMGFLRTQGNVKIFDLDSFKDASKIQENIGYLAGELSLFDQMTGRQFIDFIFKMKKLSNHEYKEELIKYWELNDKVKIKKMSKGMKQKVGLIIAFMDEAPLIILDEPTSSLDPLMQRKFVKLIHEAKLKKQTILMSSHIFEEIEHTCDRIIMIKDGHVVADEDTTSLRKSLGKNIR